MKVIVEEKKEKIGLDNHLLWVDKRTREIVLKTKGIHQKDESGKYTIIGVRLAMDGKTSVSIESVNYNMTPFYGSITLSEER